MAEQSSTARPMGGISLKGLALTTALGALVLTLTYLVTQDDNATQLEQFLLQFIFLLFGIGFSFYIGRTSVAQGAAEVIAPHAQKSIRRILNLAAGIQEFAVTVDAHREIASAVVQEHGVPLEAVERMCDALLIQTRSDLRTAEDAIEDWRDIAPDAVSSVERRLAAAGRQRYFGE